MPSLVNLLLYLLGGAALGTLMLITGIPAGPLLGAILGAGLLSISGQLEIANWPLGTKTLLGIAIGTVIGTGINRETLGELQSLWKPALVITFTLLITGILVALLISKYLGVDKVVAILGAAPGGTIGMSLVGAEFGVGAAVAALHAVRLITVLFLIPTIVNLLDPGRGIGIPK
ncbi:MULTISPECIES: AbrB family transcriptional regulator [unclassified Prochlorococcus]|uniref:AbrB family transcriptional regulator n=1 Tax=unclassified Prochlorococcus TaxID=2627481 RepID=UPI000533A187|nr:MULTISPECIES: AbrB family transcriptional regulator [unclassified Prochlorococcus]KGG15589.1 putative ammonia monooxygenase [Prochlorococcus sp. MIT 0602]KGG17869.1 putative ammonia monooxygenase [Prochlorococcus sp. MIT 0603]